jgi:hypothetical protein
MFLYDETVHFCAFFSFSKHFLSLTDSRIFQYLSLYFSTVPICQVSLWLSPPKGDVCQKELALCDRSSCLMASFFSCDEDCSKTAEHYLGYLQGLPL